MNKYLEDFLRSMTQNFNASSLTVSSYRRSISLFFSSAGICSLSDINTETIKKYRTKLDDSNLSASTKNLYLISIRSFLKYIIWQGLPCLQPQAIQLYKIKNIMSEPISKINLKSFLDFRREPRIDFIVNFLFQTGLRLAELCSLKTNQLSANFSIVGKGRRQRPVFVAKDSLKLLEKYLSTRPQPKQSDENLLLNRNGFPLHSRSIERDFVKRNDLLSITPTITPHTLRHAYATTLLENGAPIHTVQRLLGHASIASTQKYLHLTDDFLKQSYQEYHPVL